MGKLEFQPLINQDGLRNGLLRTKDGNYVPMRNNYTINCGEKKFRFVNAQDRLGEGYVNVETLVGDEGPSNDYKYLPICEIMNMEGKIEYFSGCFVATAVYGNQNA